MKDGTVRPEELVVLVDENDRSTGSMEKMLAHRIGELHRAFSVFLFDRRGRVLLQKRAQGKYHSPGLWTNACCSHPRPGEGLVEAAQRRVREELGVLVVPEPQFHFRYRAAFDNGLIENELDHVLFAQLSIPCVPDPVEVADLRWVDPAELSRELDTAPERFTVWLRECWPLVAQLRGNAGPNA